MKCHQNSNPKKRVKELMDSVRKENSEPQKESKPQNTTEKLVKQASKGPEEKKAVLKKLEHAENQLKKIRQKKY